MSNPDTFENAWYRNSMVWLLIAIPGLTIVGCMLTIYLAISNPEIIVTDPAPEGSPGTSIPHDRLP